MIFTCLFQIAGRLGTSFVIRPADVTSIAVPIGRGNPLAGRDVAVA